MSIARYFITGGTGSFGQAFVKDLLESDPQAVITIFSRDEMKQWHMSNRFNTPRLRFILGDVRDKEALISAMRGSKYVVHAAATKIVPTAEYNPLECIKTNVYGASNVIEACAHCSIESCVALSTDKASSPINLYGASKLASDKLFIASNQMHNHIDCNFAVVRYGNVIGSRGSVIPFFLKFQENGYLPITDPKMTRFMISLKDAVWLVKHAFEDMEGGELYIKKIPSINILDIANAVNPDIEKRIVGIRPGEKIHEEMIGQADSLSTYEYDEYFKILPMIDNIYLDPSRIKSGDIVAQNFSYSSDTNTSWMSSSNLREIIEKNKNYFLS